jgi:hypothetical protein
MAAHRRQTAAPRIYPHRPAVGGPASTASPASQPGLSASERHEPSATGTLGPIHRNTCRADSSSCLNDSGSGAVVAFWQEHSDSVKHVLSACKIPHLWLY